MTRKRKKYAAETATHTDSDADAKHQRNKVRFLKSARRIGSEEVREADSIIKIIDDTDDPSVKLFMYERMTSAKSVWDDVFVEVAQKAIQQRQRGSAARTERFEQRDGLVRKLFDVICREYPDTNMGQRRNLLREKIIDYVNDAIEYRDIEDEEWARKFLGSPPGDCDPSQPGKNKPILSDRTLRRIISGK